MKTMIKKWNGKTMTVTVVSEDTTWQFVACYESETSRWSTFAYIYTKEDEDNIPSFRKDDASDEEVGEMITRFEQEYGPKITG